MKTRKEYESAFRILRTAVASWDPLGLLGGGAPEDEWDREIALLLPKIQRAESPADVAHELVVIFGKSTGDASISIKETSEVATKWESGPKPRSSMGSGTVLSKYLLQRARIPANSTDIHVRQNP